MTKKAMICPMRVCECAMSMSRVTMCDLCLPSYWVLVALRMHTSTDRWLLILKPNLSMMRTCW